MLFLRWQTKLVSCDIFQKLFISTCYPEHSKLFQKFGLQKL
jgi:hypothetical protein